MSRLGRQQLGSPGGGGGTPASSDLTRWVSASDMIPRSTNGAGIGVLEYAANNVNCDVLDFDPATAESADHWATLPDGVTLTGFTIQPVWMAASGSGDVVWICNGRWYADGDLFDQARGTIQSTTDTLVTANTMRVAPSTPTVTPTGTFSLGCRLFIGFAREASNVGDTLGVDARLLGFFITYLT